MDDLPDPLQERADGLQAKIYLLVSKIRKPNLSATELCSLTLWSHSTANRYSLIEQACPQHFNFAVLQLDSD